MSLNCSDEGGIPGSRVASSITTLRLEQYPGTVSFVWVRDIRGGRV